MAPVEKRLKIASAGSTSSIGIGAAAGFSSSRPRSVARCRLWSLTSPAYSRYTATWLLRLACCSLKTVSGLNRWYSPSRRHWYSPPESSSSSSRPRSMNARAWRRTTSSATVSMPIPPMRDAVQVKQRSTNALSSPTASKIWAPR